MNHIQEFQALAQSTPGSDASPDTVIDWYVRKSKTHAAMAADLHTQATQPGRDPARCRAERAAALLYAAVALTHAAEIAHKVARPAVGV